MQILSENLELAEYEYRATLNNKTFGGSTATTATTQHMKTHLSSQWMPIYSHHDSSPEKLRDINEEEHSFIQVLEWWFMLESALVWWCWGDTAGWWWRDALWGNIKCVSDSVLSSPHQRSSNAQRSALPHGKVVLLTSNYPTFMAFYTILQTSCHLRHLQFGYPFFAIVA